jgi:hypothetical protein
MAWPDEKIIAILSLLVIAVMVIGVTETDGLDVVINVVCAIGGLVTGGALDQLSKED